MELMTTCLVDSRLNQQERTVRRDAVLNCHLRTWRQVKTAIAVVILFGSAVNVLASESIYVRSDGSDEQSGRSPVRALKTIQYALSIAADGATIVVTPGVYKETLKIQPATAPSGVTIYADTHGHLAGTPGEVHVEGIECKDVDWLQVIGTTIVGRFRAESVAHISLRDCAISKSAEAGVLVKHASDVQLVGCSIQEAGTDAIVMTSVANLEVVGCIVGSNRGYGLRHSDGVRATISRCQFRMNRTAMYLGTPTLVTSCLIVDNQRGILVGASQVYIDHATIAFNQTAAIDCGKQRDLGIANSIIAYNGAATINEFQADEEDIVSPYLRRNLWYSNSNSRHSNELPASELIVDPKFVSPGKRDLRLAENSPARDAADYSSQTIDLAGGPRSCGRQPDLGCWEARPKSGQTYFVSTSGNNTASGLQPSNAWLTVSKAARFAGPGDTVYVEAGIYDKPLTFRQSGDATGEVTFIADTKGKRFTKKGPVILQLAEDEHAIMQITNAQRISFTGFRFLSHKHHSSGFGIAIQHSQAIRFHECEWKGGGTCLSLLGSSALLSDCVVTGGGNHGISLRLSRVEAANCQIDDCNVGLFIDRDGSATVDQCHFMNNRTAGVYASGACWLNNCETSQNGTAGLVLFGLDGSQLTTNNLRAIGNGSYGVTFADCLLPEDSSACESWHVESNPCGVLVSSGVVSLASPTIRAGSKNAVHVKEGSFHCRQGTLSGDNVAVLAENTSTVVLRQSLLTGNNSGTAVVANGQQARLSNCIVNRFATGILSSEWCITHLANCTLANITDTAIDAKRGSVELVNTILAATRDALGPGIRVTPLVSFNHSHNLIHGFSQPIEGTTLDRTEATKDPKFVNVDEGNFRLAKGSPAINAGTTVGGNDTEDIEGNRRPSHHAFEIGAYEYTKKSGSVRILKWQEKR